MSALPSESDSGGKSSDSIYESYCFIHGAKSCNDGDSSSPNLVHSAKWWLNHHGHGRILSHDGLSLSEAEVKRVNTSDVKLYEEENMEKQLIDEYYATFSKSDSSCASQKQLSSDCKVSQDCSLQELGCMMSDDNLLANAYSMDLESFGSVPVEMSKKLSDLDSHWIEHKKIEPWWQTADKNDIGLSVSQRSPQNMRSSDLVEKLSADRDLPRFGQVEQFNIDKETYISRGVLASVTRTNISHTDDSSQENGASVIKSTVEKQGLAQCLQQEPEGTSSNRFKPAKVASSSSSDTSEPTSGNLSRAQLLEALCHSQTRAREAEKLAQAACDEKDHMINLFFQQASCLFAYRQWLRLLQLETICLHLKSNDQVKSLTAPNVSSWPRTRGNPTRKNHQKAASKNYHGRPKRTVRKCAIAFAIGVSLVGAGFLVGLTIGWFFPAF